MSYDLRICGKLEGLDEYIAINYPEFDEPTYNLRNMFVACMDWDFDQGIYYKCSEIIDKIEHGIKELKTKESWYRQYDPPNGWGDLDVALKTLISVRKCIYETAENIPMEHLYFRW